MTCLCGIWPSHHVRRTGAAATQTIGAGDVRSTALPSGAWDGDAHASGVAGEPGIAIVDIRTGTIDRGVEVGLAGLVCLAAAEIIATVGIDTTGGAGEETRGALPVLITEQTRTALLTQCSNAGGTRGQGGLAGGASAGSLAGNSNAVAASIGVEVHLGRVVVAALSGTNAVGSSTEGSGQAGDRVVPIVASHGLLTRLLVARHCETDSRVDPSPAASEASSIALLPCRGDVGGRQRLAGGALANTVDVVAETWRCGDDDRTSHTKRAVDTAKEVQSPHVRVLQGVGEGEA